MRVEDVRRVAIVGAGTMGQQIAFQCAGHGCDVVMYDIDEAALEQAGARIDAYAQGLEASGVTTPEVTASARQRITLTTDLSSAAADADMLSEAVPEDPDLKGRVLAAFNAECPSRTIFTTNTSGGSCIWQLGGTHIPGTTNVFGGTSATEYGTNPLALFYPAANGGPQYIYEDFRNILSNPCPA